MPIHHFQPTRYYNTPGTYDPVLHIKDGDTVDGPGGIRWQGRSFEDSLGDPPRQVLRFLPTGVSRIPQELMGKEMKTDTGQSAKKKKKWKFW